MRAAQAAPRTAGQTLGANLLPCNGSEIQMQSFKINSKYHLVLKFCALFVLLLMEYQLLSSRTVIDILVPVLYNNKHILLSVTVSILVL